MRRLEFVDWWKGVGYCFCCFLRSLHDLLVMESGCSDNGAGKLFWGIKKRSFCCFLVAIKSFSHFISECQWKYAVRFEDEIKGS